MNQVNRAPRERTNLPSRRGAHSRATLCQYELIFKLPNCSILSKQLEQKTARVAAVKETTIHDTFSYLVHTVFFCVSPTPTIYKEEGTTNITMTAAYIYAAFQRKVAIKTTLPIGMSAGWSAGRSPLLEKQCVKPLCTKGYLTNLVGQILK